MTNPARLKYTPTEVHELYKLYRTYLEHEDNLINYRCNWMYLIQSFLVATYGFTIQKKLEVLGHIEKPLHDIPEFLQETLIQIDRFLYVISVVGIIVSCIGLPSVYAAISSIKSLRTSGMIFDVIAPPARRIFLGSPAEEVA